MYIYFKIIKLKWHFIYNPIINTILDIGPDEHPGGLARTRQTERDSKVLN